MLGKNPDDTYILDPRQKYCWDLYTDPESKTFGNITQSAIKAGYTEGYADEVSQMEWFKMKLWRLNASFTGERKLKEILELPLKNDKGHVDVGVTRIQADLAKFVTSTQGKADGWAAKQEIDVTSKGEPITGFNYVIPEKKHDPDNQANV